MDNKILNKLFGIISTSFACGLSFYVITMTLLPGFRSEILLLFLPATLLFIAGNMFNQNSKIAYTKHKEKCREKYIKAMKELAQTKVKTVKMTKCIDKYDMILAKQYNDNLGNLFNMFNTLKETNNFDEMKVDYECLTFEGLKSENLITQSVTCHYNDFNSFLQDHSKKIQEYVERIKYLKDIEVKITYTYKDINDNLAQVENINSNCETLLVFDECLKRFYPNSFSYDNKISDYHEKYAQLKEYREKRAKQNDNVNDKDDLIK